MLIKHSPGRHSLHNQYVCFCLCATTVLWARILVLRRSKVSHVLRWGRLNSRTCRTFVFQSTAIESGLLLPNMPSLEESVSSSSTPANLVMGPAAAGAEATDDTAQENRGALLGDKCTDRAEARHMRAGTGFQSSPARRTSQGPNFENSAADSRRRRPRRDCQRTT
jgi:hypothetical protein